MAAVVEGKDLSREEGQMLGPEWLAHRYEEDTDRVRFVDYSREERSSVPFLIDSYLPAKPFRSESRERAIAMAPPTSPIHFIFHSGFCCSTLLASCFDQTGLATAFSEPMILNDITGWRGRGASPSAVGKVLTDALSLLSRPFAGDQAAIVKPSTIVNGLAPAIVRMRPDARAIVMHAPVEDFITSIAKKGIDGRLWARELFTGMRKEGLTQPLGFTDEQLFGQTDLQIAAAAWLGQQALFQGLEDFAAGRVRSIDSKTFLADPDGTIRSAAEFFELQMSSENLDAARRGPLSRNSKDGAPFSSGERDADYSSARQLYGDEIEKVAGWAASVAQSAGVATELSNPLI